MDEKLSGEFREIKGFAQLLLRRHPAQYFDVSSVTLTILIVCAACGRSHANPHSFNTLINVGSGSCHSQFAFSHSPSKTEL